MKFNTATRVMYAVAFLLVAGPLLLARVEGAAPPFAATMAAWMAMKLEDLNGVWRGDGDAIHQAVWNRKGGLPNCKAHSGFAHLHYFGDDHFYTIHGGNNSSSNGIVSVGHRTTTHYKTVTQKQYTISYIMKNGKRACMHWRPYVDRTTGHLRVVSLSSTIYIKAANGTVTTESATCSLKGVEVPGCKNLSANRVQGVAYATYTCMNGECAKKAPFYQQVDAMESH